MSSVLAKGIVETLLAVQGNDPTAVLTTLSMATAMASSISAFSDTTIDEVCELNNQAFRTAVTAYWPHTADVRAKTGPNPAKRTVQ